MKKNNFNKISPLIKFNPEDCCQMILLQSLGIDYVANSSVCIRGAGLGNGFGYRELDYHFSILSNNLQVTETEYRKIDLSSQKNFKKTIIELLNNDYFILPEIDFSKIQAYSKIKARVPSHKLFIYGYDKINDSFYTSDFFNFRDYSHIKIPTNELYLSFVSMNELIHFPESDIWLKKILLFKFDFTSSNNIHIYRKMLRSNIKLFFDSSLDTRRTDWIDMPMHSIPNDYNDYQLRQYDIVYGIQIFDLAKKYLAATLNNNNTSFPLKSMAFYTNIVKYFNCCSKISKLKNDYSSCAIISEKIKNLSIKYFITNNPKYLNSIIDMHTDLKIVFTSEMQSVLDELNKLI